VPCEQCTCVYVKLDCVIHVHGGTVTKSDYGISAVCDVTK
jgi:hypothetical protein